ncbi:bifunctional phosphopantothenoylcysteine decarboxylase/phosphopantothenate--cysteine ligase CoaBC [Faecalicatena contorta]|uniref:bifunctional phosphopantothenoylcysteine decarboxylase/phosphopantothenate--cysteine ligase CoaBC n=1 Tax=Faecalicatena contorta TaxID=39482 RepID=UPI001F28F82D|nr:bifunctional phosphopantothenoylcysteine decarboxylase/phosphopantothenate--cysteine ligase CoaBC [Faecalicatena contorta]MCF2684197.1 bifunctional phosphopantothenoylcysteine decarboxylase/phosphopantothenate--cysteine ligase CoaBC [Faecalicatena contorta]
MLKGKTVLLGVTGGIASYKSASLASLLVKSGAQVHVLMTENAKNFINPITFETLTGHKCLTDTFDRNFEFNVEHVALAKKADLVMIAPATANVIAKLAHGIADDMLTTTILACRCPKIIAPAMNTAMYENQITQDNMNLLRKYGMEVITPACGHLACGDTGAGKMPEPETLIQYIYRELAHKKDMKGLKVLVTAGPTQESIDPVRYITNHSSGKMGYCIARACMLRGADVTLVSGKTALTPPMFVNVVPVVSARDMYEAVTSRSNDMNIIIKAAAVADYRPASVADEKMKKADAELSISLERTDDILKYLGDHKTSDQFLCGFSMETQNMLENSKKKLVKKNLDMIVANNLKVKGAGFETDTNIVTMITPDSVCELELMSKEDVAFRLTDKILELMDSPKKASRE